MTDNRCDLCGVRIPPKWGAFCWRCSDAIWDHHYDRHDDGDSE